MDKTPIDILWVLMAGGLVFMMQGGFLCLESGLTRSKNSINVAIKNLTDFGVAVILYWIFGFAMMFGITKSGLVGTTHFFTNVGLGGAWLSTFFLFQVMFCATAATIVSGAVAERIRFKSYIIVTIVISGLIYPLFGHWAWGGAYEGAVGWLSELGFVDFAGSTVVHSVGGWVALAILMIIGPRTGRFPKGQPPRKIQGNNLPLAMLGVVLLFFGWFGFNGGSTLTFNDQVPGIVANTALAGASGLVVTLFIGWTIKKIPDVSLPMNGTLAGLVAITANCHAVSASSAVIIGGVGGSVMLVAEHLLERFQIDDVIGAVPVHLVAGVWGTIAVALFGDLEILGTGLTRLAQLKIQLIGIFTCFLFAFVVTYIIFRVINRYLHLRVTSQEENDGLNVAEHGATTEILDLVLSMDKQEKTQDFELRAHEEPFTEVGQIAHMYNKVMNALDKSMKKLKSTQSMLIQAGKLSAIGQLGAGIAHELNQPLAAIQGYTQIMIEEIKEDDPHCSDLKMIEDQTHRMSKIINNIRIFARESKIKMDLIDIHKPIDDAILLFTSQLKNHNIEVIRKYAQDIPKINGDSNQLQQVFINLISNARDELDNVGAGKLWINTKLVKRGKRKTDLKAEISFINEGALIPGEVLDKIFDPFFTTKEPGKGTGLGLSISYGIIKNHQGEISVSNKEDGVEFLISLPIYADDY